MRRCRLDSGIAVDRLSVPPVVHYSPEVTTTLHAATTVCASEQYTGDWIPADDFLAKVVGLVLEVALTAYFLTVCQTANC